MDTRGDVEDRLRCGIAQVGGTWRRRDTEVARELREIVGVLWEMRATDPFVALGICNRLRALADRLAPDGAGE